LGGRLFLAWEEHGLRVMGDLQGMQEWRNAGRSPQSEG
jgi:hypothetical protein